MNLKLKEVNEAFKNQLMEEEPQSSNAKFINIKNWILKAAIDTIPYKTRTNPQWMSKEALEIIESKTETMKKFGLHSAEYKTVSKKAKMAVKKAKEDHLRTRLKQNGQSA